MVKFDRIKVSAYLDCVNDFNANYFKVDEEGGIIRALRYKSNNPRLLPLPFSLSIDIDFVSDEIIINIPSKILGDDYPKLISAKTIEECIDALQQIDLVEIDVTAFLTSALVLSVDVTKDISILLGNEDYAVLSRIIKNDNKWKAELYINGVLFQNRVQSGRHKIALEIYGKGHELLMSKNSSFLEWCEKPETLMDYFHDKTRMELKLRSKYLLKRFFKTDDMRLLTILLSETNPLELITAEIFDTSLLDPVSTGLMNKKWSNIGEYKKYLVVKEANFDLNKLRYILKGIYSKKTNLRAAIRPYKQLLNQYKTLGNVNSENGLEEFIKAINNNN